MRRPISSVAAFLREREWAVILGVGLVAFALGVVGYAKTERLIDAVYLSLKLFALDFGQARPPWQLEVARFLAPATTGLAGVRALVAVFAAEVEQVRAARSEGHVVLCGLGRRGGRLVETFRARGERVVAIERDAAAPGVQACRLQGGLVLVGDASNATMLRRAAAHRARGVIAVCTDDDVNLQVGRRVDELTGGGAGSVGTTFVHVGDEELWRVLRERAVSIPSVEMFNIFDRGARSLLRQHPLPMPQAGGSAHVAVVGLGRPGTELVVAIARLWDVLGRASSPRLRLTAVDPLATERITRLHLRHPQLGTRLDIDVIAEDASTPAFEAARFLFDDAGTVDTDVVYVCLEDDAQALAAGLTLRRRLGLHPVPVVVQMSSAPKAVAGLLQQASAAGELAGPLVVFDLVEQTCSPELLFDHTTETVARALHEEYLRHQLAAGRAVVDKPHVRRWEELDEPVREDNRAQARHIGVKLAAVGCDVQLLDDWDAPLVELDEEEVELLARMEHQRWLDARVAAGWRRGPRDDAARLHPDVVPWSELAEESREIDRAFVRALPVVLAKAGFQVLRRRS